jgi:type II secretory pathway pseudopilin PulG
MLFVFLLAACVAISLYMELPRVMFEAQRNKEQLLIDRGEQYRRAIQLYFRATRTYPPNLDALENTNNRRYLRRRYKDPMTGEDAWRLVHIAAGGVFPDSLVNKPPVPPGQTESSASTSASTSTEKAAVETAPSPWQQRRPSDISMPLGQAQNEMPQPGMEPQPDNQPVEPTLAQENPPGSEPQPGAYPQPAMGPGQQPGVPQPGQTGPSQPQVVPGVPVMAGGARLFPGGFPPQPVTGAGQQPPAPGQPAPASNPALDAIRTMLTTPNPRGLAAIQPSSTGPQLGMSGIAGVASKLEAEGIKVYNDRTKYNEWEFLYDARMDRTAGAPGTQGQMPGQPQMSPQPRMPTNPQGPGRR